MDKPQNWLKCIDRAIWTPHLAPLPVWKKRVMRTARLAIVLFRDITQGQLTLWTMSLVYTTLLSIVPLLALSFSVLKAFGVHNQVEPLLENLLAPLGEDGQEITSRLIGFIENMNVGVLGAVGLGLLIYTVISLVQKIEESFNAIWHVTQLRSLGDRFSRYLSVLLVGPILVFAALGITTMVVRTETVQTILAIEPFGGLVLGIGKLVPYAGDWRIHVLLHFRSEHARALRSGVRCRHRWRHPMAVGGLGIRRIRGVLDAIRGDLRELRGVRSVPDLAVRELVSSADRGGHLVLSAEPRLSLRHAWRAATQQSDA